MARIITTGDTAAKRRRKHLRSCAEVLRLMAEKGSFDEESKDMAAFLVFSLRGVHESIEESARSWDDRNYWKKSEALRHKWRWTILAADELKDLIVQGRWQLVASFLIELIPRFDGIRVQSVTRSPDWWVGARRALLKETET